MARKTIPKDIQQEIMTRIEQFNQQELQGECQYSAKFKGLFLYLNRADYGGRPHPIARLSYTGTIDGWEFVIYKYSRDDYDPDEWMFPGTQFLDGTIEGAMRCGLEAYTLL
ncbi:hypothetical protein [Desulfobulbus alkaliphilus]|uniref:hypothetical protein n=1 Tax=Desulfobulbus alkaliphilus TaxID=869814 RepID=UPI001964EA69|nr:hypothetical protein [Desulfobulbus alkaliphilus]MBM9537685.1 hypothetical protein [Desulfobulbus alkaliphilus]